MTLKQHLLRIKAIGQTIPQVKLCAVLSQEDVSNNGYAQYPLLMIFPNSFNYNIDIDSATEVINLDIVCLDSLRQDNSNVIDCYNWTHEILQKFLTLIMLEPLLNAVVSSNAIQIVDEIPDHSAGWKISLQITVPYLRAIC